MVKKTEQTQKPGKVKRFFRSFVNYKAWVSYDELNQNVSNVVGLLKRFCSLNKNQPETIQETYQEAIIRLGLSQQEEEKRRKTFWWSSMIYLAFCLLFLGYFFYLLTIGRIWVALLVTIFIGIMGLSAYREHFWYFQMTKKQLGNHFKDWLNFVLKRH